MISLVIIAHPNFDDIEIADLHSNQTICENLPNFPLPTAGAVGGLDFNDKPLICGGESVWVSIWKRK
jgi:hypothetical protein